MRRRRKLVHVRSDFCNERTGSNPIYTRNSVPAADRILKRLAPTLNLLCDFRNLSLQKKEMIEQLSQPEPMMIEHSAMQCQPQFWNPVSQAPLRHFRKPVGIALTGNDCAQHVAPRLA